jgi:FkbM family methyltransferase
MIKQIIRAITSRFKLLIKIYIYRDKKELAYVQWIRDNKKKERLRLNYSLNDESIVFDVGGYKGDFTHDITDKFDCIVYVFEPVDYLFKEIEKCFIDNPKVFTFNFGLSDINKDIDITLADNSSSIYGKKGSKQKIKLVSSYDFMIKNNIQNIDLMKINIEGGEYEVLPNLIENKFIENIKNIQVQFHDFVDDSIEKRKSIVKELTKTHNNLYSYYMIWESWELKLSK